MNVVGCFVVGWFPGWLVIVGSLVRWLAGALLVGWLLDWLAGWLTGWLVGQLAG